MTFLVLLAWVVLSHLASGQGLRAAAEGLILILSVFGIVVLHEFGHVLTARRFGIRTRDITLLPIGGVASLDRIPEDPRHELAISLAGPCVNIVLALGIATILFATGSPLLPDLQVVGGNLLAKLLWVNVTLAVFNVLPAFPMDGGRIFRAALAIKMGHRRATAVAARLGQGMAILFAFIGLAANPVLIFIAMFVWIGAQEENARAQLESALHGIPLRKAMITDYRTLSPGDPLSRAMELIVAGFQHDFPVVDRGVVVGLLGWEDVVRALRAKGRDQRIADVMQREFQTADPGEPLEGVLGLMSQGGGTSIIVQQQGRILGLVTRENVGELVALENASPQKGLQ